MSGGSFEYLFLKSAEDLISHVNTVGEMAEALGELGWAEDAAIETEELFKILSHFRVRIEVRKRRLENVWHAMEWWRSGDSGEDHLREALVKFRKEIEGK